MAWHFKYVINILKINHPLNSRSETTLGNCLVGNKYLPFFLQTFDVSLIVAKKLFVDEWRQFQIVKIVTSKTLCTLISWWSFLFKFFETASFGCLNSFLIAAACFITDSRDSKISKAFYKDKFAPSLNNLCCMRSWFIPHTKWSLNIESKEWPYSQYWLSLLSSAIYCDTLSPVFLLHMLNWSLSAIGFLFVFSWFAIKITNLLKVFSTGFTGPVCPLNNQYISIRQDV